MSDFTTFYFVYNSLQYISFVFCYNQFGDLNMSKGMFITFEGADGCGKSTQLSLLNEYLAKNGFKVLVTREPGAKGLGERLRDILLNYDGEVSNRCESFLFLADRAQHIDTIVKPAIENGYIVLCDRHTDSTVAYQGYGRGLDIERINYLNDLATDGLKPNLTFVFDVDVDTSMSRVGSQKDRMESAGIEFSNFIFPIISWFILYLYLKTLGFRYE